MLNNREIYEKDHVEFLKNFLIDIYNSYTYYINLIDGYFGPSLEYSKEIQNRIQEIRDIKDAKEVLIEIDKNFSKVFVKVEND